LTILSVKWNLTKKDLLINLLNKKQAIKIKLLRFKLKILKAIFKLYQIIDKKLKEKEMVVVTIYEKKIHI
jgi:hypothetical protein